MCVSVKTFSIRYEIHWYDKKQPNFPNKRENQWKISQKSNLILLGPSHPHLKHPHKMQHLIFFTCTMKDKVKFYLHHEEQGLFQHRSSECKHIAHKIEELLLDSSDAAT